MILVQVIIKISVKKFGKVKKVSYLYIINNKTNKTMFDGKSLTNTQIRDILSVAKAKLDVELQEKYMNNKISIGDSIVDRVNLLIELTDEFNDAIKEKGYDYY